LRRSKLLLAAAMTLLAAWEMSTACASGASLRQTATVLGPWPLDTAEGQVFNKVIMALGRDHGLDVSYRGIRDVVPVLDTQVNGGTPPDIVVLPNPAALAKYASNPRAGLKGVNPQQGAGMLYSKGASTAYGAIVKVSLKSMIWYGGNSPTVGPVGTWEQLVELTQRLRQSGQDSWCLGLADGSGSGWPGTDWIEDLVLHRWGANTYADWASGNVPWTDPRIRQAFQDWGQLLASAGASDAASSERVLATSWNNGVDRRNCALEHQGSFVQAEWKNARSTNIGFFGFPSVGAQSTGDTVEVSVDVAGLFGSTPRIRNLFDSLAHAKGQEALRKEAKRQSVTFWPWQAKASDADEAVDTAVLKRLGARRCLDASDFMPRRMASSFTAAVLKFVSDPNRLNQANLDELLVPLEQARKSVPSDNERLDQVCPM
jgi:alpha-glucoside transport system substrate-binding protein